VNLKHFIEQFKLLSPITQVTLIVFAGMVIVLLVFFPSAGTSIITFLLALKMLVTQQ